MGKGIEIGIASETKAYKQGVEIGVIKPTEDAIEALDELGKGEGLDNLEESLEDAQDASKKLQRETRDTADEIEQEYRRAYREMKEAAEDGTEAAGEGIETMQEKGLRGAARIGGSFKDVGSILDGVQRTASTALSGFGPAGMVAGALAATGIGLVTDAIKSVQDEADKMKERISAAYQSAAEEGRNALDEAQIQAAALDIIFDTPARLKAQKEAAEIGVSAQTYIRALAGDQAALTVAIEASAAAEQKVKDSMVGQVGAQGEALSNYNDSVNLATVINQKLEAQQKIMTENTAAANLALTIHGQDHETIQKTNKALAETPKTVPVGLAVDTSKLDEIERNPRKLRLTIDVFDRYGRQAI